MCTVGGARLVLDMAMKFAKFFKRLTEMIDRLSDHLGYLMEFAKIVDELLIQTTTASAYHSLMKFSQEAHHVFIAKSCRKRTIILLRTLVVCNGNLIR